MALATWAAIRRSPLLLLLVFLTQLLLMVDCQHDHVVFASDDSFKVDFTKLTIKQPMTGSTGHSGSEFLLSDGDKQYTMRFSSDHIRFREELIADALYSALHVNVPRFIVVLLHNLNSLQTPLRSAIGDAKLVRIAEYMVAEEMPEEVVLHAVQELFVVDSFLGNHDCLEKRDLVFYKGKVYSTFHGDSLRNRNKHTQPGSEYEAEWSEPRLIPELRLFPKVKPDIYLISVDRITRQTQMILSRVEQLQRTFLSIAKALHMEVHEQRALWGLLMGRMQVLEMMVNPGVSYPAQLNRPLSVASSSGVMLFAQYRGAPHVLLGKRRSSAVRHDGHWSSVGGKCDLHRDKDFAETAARELYEETTGALNVSAKTISMAPFHDLVYVDKIFRMHFVQVEYVDVKAMRGPKPPTLQASHSTGKEEYHAWKWFPISLLINIDSKGRMSDRYQPLYFRFNDVAQIPHVKDILWAVSVGTPLTATSSTPVSSFITPTTYTAANGAAHTQSFIKNDAVRKGRDTFSFVKVAELPL
ncbi:hypothetical protein B484DRAFT_448652 [Ochromonadaceae sp. CCMP2298]|nr:hypothetical protein B484DRAFT_448652 [Ochromonadaceae sp. CCMP2298]